jgi:hypothetical protein
VASPKNDGFNLRRLDGIHENSPDAYACSEHAEIPFDNILDRLTGSDPSVTDYVFEVPARCLQFGAEISGKTLVEWAAHDQPS